MSAVIQNEYTGNNSTTTYSFTFPYLKTSDIKASLDGVATTAFTLPNATTLQFNTAPGSGVKIKIFRETSVDDLTATFYAGSAIKSEDLNDNFTQNLYKTQEVGERALNSLGGTMTGNLTLDTQADLVFEGATADAHETTIKVADPTADRTITFPNVSGNVVTTGDTGTVATGMIANSAVTTAKINDDAITTAKIAANQITTAKIADNQITSAKINPGAVGTTDLANDAVTAAKLADNAVVTANIVDANVTTAKIAADAVTNAKIANNSIDSEHYVVGSIDNVHLANNSVTLAKMQNNSVGTAELVDSSVDTARLADNSVTLAKMTDNSVGTSEIVNTAVTTAKLADNNVTTAKLNNNAVTTAKIAADQVTTAKIADNAITSAKINPGAVSTTDIATSAVTTAKIAGANVTEAKLASNSVTTSKIGDGQVTNVKISNGDITLAKLASDLKQTSISDSDTQIPTSGAVVDYVTAQIAPIGGLEVIATEVAFPNTQPASGVVISISDAGGVVFNGSGTSTTGRTVGGSTVTINNAPSSLNSETLVAGVGLMVSSTGSGQVYNYHKILGKEDDIKQLSDDINDFNARYRVGSSNPTSALDAGDLFFNTSTSKLLVYNATNTAWEEAQSIGNFFISTLSPAFNGSVQDFTITNAPTNAEQIILSIDGVIQKPNAGTSTPSEGFALSGSTVKLAAAPASGASYFAVVVGSTVNIGQPSNNTVSTSILQSGAVTTDKIADNAVTGAKIADNLDIADNNKIRFGTGNDLEIYHDGSNSYISDIGTGELLIQGSTIRIKNGAGTETFANFINNGAVELYHDNSKKLDTYSSGVSVYGNLALNDNGIIAAGDSGDLQMYHDGSNSYIKEGGAGNLYIFSQNLRIENADGSKSYIEANNGGATELYYDGVKKFDTTASGISVTTTSDNATAAVITNSGTSSAHGLNVRSGSTGVGGDLFKLESHITSTPQTKFLIRCDGHVDLPQDSTSFAVNRLRLGAGNDLQLYHDGTDSNIVNYTGGLSIRNATGNTSNVTIKSQNDATIESNNDIFLKPQNGENGIGIIGDGGVKLYYNNLLKVETLDTGFKVHGRLETDTTTSSYLFVPHDDNLIKFDQGQKAITSNDSTGNFNFKTGSDASNQHINTDTNTTSGIAQMSCDSDGVDGSISFGVGPRRSGGSSALYTNGMVLDYQASGLNGLKYITSGTGNIAPSGLTTEYNVIHQGNATTGEWSNDASNQVFKLLGDGGDVALTTNDNYGNANLTFNCASGLATTAGSAWRMTAAVDSVNGHFVISNDQSVSSGGAAVMTNRFEITETGTFIGSSSNNISDQRLKKNIATISDATTKIKGLKGRTFEWKDEAKLESGTQYGFIAQEMESVVSDLVSDGKDWGLRAFDSNGDLLQDSTSDEGKTKIAEYSKGVNVNGVIPILVEALKESITKIETLETKVAALEAA